MGCARFALFIGFCALGVQLGLGSAVADKRVALVIGMSAYKYAPTLENPGNDARLMAGTLRDLGFTLSGNGPLLDLDKPGLELAIQNFSRQIQGADVALFFYSGHGLQVRGENYLIPVAANLTRESDVDFQLIDANVVLRQMEHGQHQGQFGNSRRLSKQSLWGTWFPRAQSWSCANAGA